MILDTNAVINKVKRKEHIPDNITSITQVEYPPILEYQDFSGDIVSILEQDVELASELQVKLRKMGKAKSVGDLIIAAICINRGEPLLTTDGDFKDIAALSKLILI